MNGWIVYLITDTGRSVEHWLATSVSEAQREVSRLHRNGARAYARRSA